MKRLGDGRQRSGPLDNDGVQDSHEQEQKWNELCPAGGQFKKGQVGSGFVIMPSVAESPVCKSLVFMSLGVIYFVFMSLGPHVMHVGAKQLTVSLETGMDMQTAHLHAQQAKA